MQGKSEARVRPALDRARQRGRPPTEVDSVAGLPRRVRRLDLALVVGAERHAGLGDADYAVRDAEAFRRHAETLLGVRHGGSALLLDARATREAILREIERLGKDAQPGTRFWFYYAGHGGLDPLSGTPYLATWESEPRYWSKTSLTLADLFRALAEVPALEVVAVLDASFSGVGDRTWSEAARRGEFPEARPEPSRGSNLTVLYAAAPGQTALVLDDEGHGAFTFELLRSMQAEAGRPGARLDEILRSAWRSVAADARAQGRVQTSAASGSGQRVELW